MRLALEAAATGVWEYDVVTERLSWDRRVREVAEIGPRAAPTWSRDFLPSVHPEDQEAVATAFGRLLAAGLGARLSLTCRIKGRKSGKITWTALEGVCLKRPGGGLRVIGTARDVTEAVVLNERLTRLNEELEDRVHRAVAERQVWADMFETADDPIAAVNLELQVIAMNGAYRSLFKRFFGVEIEVGDHLPTRLAHLPQARDVSTDLWRRAAAGEVIDVPRSWAPGEDLAAFDIKFRPLRDRTGALIGAFQYSRNVTQRVIANQKLKEAQAALHRAQKMESIGQLTGGIAHDFNNLLQVIGGNLQLLRGDLLQDPPALRRVDGALAGVARGATLAAQLLAFGRRQPLEPKVVALGKIVYGMDELLRRTLGETVELMTSVQGGLWNTLVDPAQLENALLNLALNARDAMPLGGRLTIEACNAVLDEDYARRHSDVSAGDYVMVGVTDTGIGMSAAVAEKVFEPFFTTKPEGKGSGLGLSMVYGLVKQSGGHVKIYSEVGEGTTIKLYLPRSAAAESGMAPEEEGEVEGGHETVLVVEDDPAVREIAVALLGDLGYQVLKAQDAMSALAVIESGLQIDVLFTDVVMPGPLRSPELAQRARERLPGLAVLFTSGYTENAIVHGGRLDEGVELLSKPYVREALARKIRKVLADARAPDAELRPAKAPALRAPLAEPLPAAPPAGEAATVRALVVEDDELVRANVMEMAKALGVRAFEAAEAGAALELLARERVDVLITDRNLPGLSGDELARRALALQPRLGLIFAAGEAAAVPDPSLAAAVFLVKPYGRLELQQALDQSRSGRRAGEGAWGDAEGRLTQD
jgi:signal transduction histidine kinase/CheY-like chemotaxis protein